ncbi:type I pullulanase [Phocaeicola salanitronis]|uniref:type I pullulanase n=1 Tax=Phocaeicola salanitronis TaxID=376805 RepID=UPI0023F9AFC4|nr:type I pullulanase [Phocaeicola salanitronis]
MNIKTTLLMGILATLISACRPHSVSYASFDEYPVYEGGWEEMAYTPGCTDFALWAPTAQAVRVLVYETGQGGAAKWMIDMQPAGNGMWRVSVKSDLKGYFYAFNVRIDGAWQGDTPGLWAKAVGVNGNRAAILDMQETDPEGWKQDKRPPMKSFSDMVIYEMHLRDFSADTVGGMKHRGKYLALAEDSTHTWTGERTGLAHLKELGVTHVQLMPVADFASIDETKPERLQYNWGYDPKNYNVPEGSYATDPFEPGIRIREFKQMVQALHKAGIRVIMDVVYNHTFTTHGGIFERTVPGYFYRKDADGNFANGSGCGNETASERAMMRRFIVESVCYWAKEYHIDGFRFDLMGLHDIETMNAVRRALDRIDPTIYVGGEGWSASVPQFPSDLLATKANVSKIPRIAVFRDEFRDSLRGPFGNDEKGAFLIGRPGYERGIRFGLSGGVYSLTSNDSVPLSPMQFISYVSCHDDLCLADRLKVTLPGASVQELCALQKLGATAILTSQGIPFLFAGDEFLRDRKGAPNPYNMPDAVNAINWHNKMLYREVFDYYRGLIAMRKAHPAFRMGDAELVRTYLEFLPVQAVGVVAFRLKGNPCGDSWLNTIVVLNARTEPVKVDIPDGKYWIVCQGGKIDLVMGLGTVTGTQLVVHPRSATIIHQ